MNIEIISTILGALASLLAGGLASTELFQKLTRQALGKPKDSTKRYSERLAELTASLTKASRELDAVLMDLAQVAHGREAAVQKLEAELASLESREQDLKQRIEAFEKTPLPVAEHFARLIEVGEKRSRKRDYTLFGVGVMVTTAIAILIQVFAR